MKLTDPGIYSILFISMIEGVYVLGFGYFFSIFQKQKLTGLFFSIMYGLFTLLILINYFLVYRKARQYEYYNNKLNAVVVIIIIILGYVLMGVGGQMARQLSPGKI